MPDGWENRQIVFIVRVEAKQQFLSEIPYVGAILSLVFIFPKDKSGRFSVDSYENYVECMQERVEHEEVVTEKEKERIVNN